MRAYIFNANTADIEKRFTKKEAWPHVPLSEPNFKRAPYIEIYLEETPKKGRITAIRISFRELRTLMKRCA